eukprot:1700477-Pyramimonas_sp.AAC.1
MSPTDAVQCYDQRSYTDLARQQTELHHPPLDHRPAPMRADGVIRTGHVRRTSPGAASAAASAQTRHVSPVRPPSPTQPVPSQTWSCVFATATNPLKESDTARAPQLPRTAQLQEWQHMLRSNSGSASGRPAKAHAFLC